MNSLIELTEDQLRMVFTMWEIEARSRDPNYAANAKSLVEDHVLNNMEVFLGYLSKIKG